MPEHQILDSLFSCFNKIVVFDTETTGLDCNRDEIIEVAMLKIAQDAESYHIENELNVLVQLTDGRKLPNKITGLTGITEQMLLHNGESKAEVCRQIVDILNEPNTLLVAFNAQFDLCFLYFFLLKHNCADILKQVKLLDAMTIYKDRRDYPHKLSDAIETYSLEYQNSHRAIDDVKAMLELLIAMERERGDLFRYINLFGYNPRYGVSGPKISSVKYLPQGYDRHKRLYE
jgi:DNA polymerase-3 subunit epsilon